MVYEQWVGSALLLHCSKDSCVPSRPACRPPSPPSDFESAAHALRPAANVLRCYARGPPRQSPARPSPYAIAVPHSFKKRCGRARVYVAHSELRSTPQLLGPRLASASPLSQGVYRSLSSLTRESRGRFEPFPSLWLQLLPELLQLDLDCVECGGDSMREDAGHGASARPPWAVRRLRRGRRPGYRDCLGPLDHSGGRDSGARYHWSERQSAWACGVGSRTANGADGAIQPRWYRAPHTRPDRLQECGRGVDSTRGGELAVVRSDAGLAPRRPPGAGDAAVSQPVTHSPPRSRVA